MAGEEELKSGEEQFASLGDLCEIGAPVTKVYPQIGKLIQFKPALPMDRYLFLQERYNLAGGKGKRDTRGFMVAVLKDVLVQPKIVTPDDERAILKANSGVIFDVLADVLGSNDESFQAIKEDMGES